MKKAVVILLILIYSSATMGATVHLHYCMNEIVGRSFLHNDDGKCGKCGMEEQDKEGCCKDEKKQFKLKTDHPNVSSTSFLTMASDPAVVTDFPNFNFKPLLITTEKYSTCHAPPGIGNIRLHILHCVFLIWLIDCNCYADTLLCIGYRCMLYLTIY